MKLTEAVLHSLSESVLCWLATSSSSGQPSVSPKEIFAPFGGDSVIIANIASPQSMRNIRENPRACVSVLDIFTQKGHQLHGSAEVLRAGDADYAAIENALRAIAGPDFPFKTVIRVHVETAREIVAPRYRLFPETTEAEQVASAMRTYRVRPIA